MGKRILLLFLLAVAAGGIWLMLRPTPPDVEAAEVRRGAIRSAIEEEGIVRVVDRYVVAAPVEGTLQRIILKEGAAVKKGDVVAEIDPLPWRSRIGEQEALLASLRQRIAGVGKKPPKPEELERAGVREEAAAKELALAEASRKEAEAALALARTDLERVKGLVAGATATREELDRAEAAERQAAARLDGTRALVGVRELGVRSARLDRTILEKQGSDFDWEKSDYAAQIEGVEATLALLRDRLMRTRVLAPADGVVLRRIEESERPVAAGTPLLEVGDLGRMEVEADFLSEDAAHMRVGMPAEIFGRALGDQVVRGEIARIDPSAFRKISTLGVEQQRVYVVVRIPGPLSDGNLNDRFRVQLRILLEERADALLVPEGALFHLEGEWHVFRVVDDRARLARVRTGVRDGRRREVLDGLAEGDRVVLHPNGAVVDGGAVKLLP